jgi:hypothetical protein
MPQASSFLLDLHEKQKPKNCQSSSAHQATDQRQQEKYEEQEKQDSCDAHCRRGNSQKTEYRRYQSYDEEYDRPTQHEASFVAEQDRRIRLSAVTTILRHLQRDRFTLVGVTQPYEHSRIAKDGSL